METSPTLWEIVLRRYRCIECGAVTTVAPRGIFTHFRYALGAIALALTWWAVVMLSASEVRGRVSPWPIKGLAESERWRSLHRWSRRGRELFGLAEPIDGVARALELLSGRAVDVFSVDQTLADATIDFGEGYLLQIFNLSSGYEGWALSDQAGRQLVAQGGGNLVDIPATAR